jgi:hypothetical protein
MIGPRMPTPHPRLAVRRPARPRALNADQARQLRALHAAGECVAGLCRACTGATLAAKPRSVPAAAPASTTTGSSHASRGANPHTTARSHSAPNDSTAVTATINSRTYRTCRVRIGGLHRRGHLDDRDPEVLAMLDHEPRRGQRLDHGSTRTGEG